MSPRIAIRDLRRDDLEVLLSQIYGFYESLGFDRTSKQAFVVTAR
jgi:hypothetical protein